MEMRQRIKGTCRREEMKCETRARIDESSLRGDSALPLEKSKSAPKYSKLVDSPALR